MTQVKAVWHAMAKPDLEQLLMGLNEMLYPPANAVALQKLDPIAEDDESAWCLEAYFDQPREEAAFRSLFDALALDYVPVQWEDIPDLDWVAHSLEGLGIVNAGRFILYGIHDADKLPNDPKAVPIRIDANQAFGTGHHPTTAGCLKALEKCLAFEPDNILDIGTGSAVLAIAAAKIWSTPVLATDIDPISIDIATKNAALNAVDTIDFICADGFQHPLIAARAPFDFIFANILAGPLVALAPAIANHASDKATIILAGLLEKQAPQVLSAYKAMGFHLHDRIDQETWPILILQNSP